MTSKDSKFASITHRAVTDAKVSQSVQVVSRFKVLSNNHPVWLFADGSCWDATSNAFVKPEDTNAKAS